MFCHWTILESVIIFIVSMQVRDITDTQKSASYLDLHLDIDNGWRLRWPHFSNSQLSPVAILQHQQRMEFTFHNSYVSLELVSRTVIFWTELSCWRTSYPSKATLLLSWRHSYTNYTVITTNWLTATKYPYPKCQWIFTEILYFIYYWQDFYKTWLQHDGVI